MLDLAFGLTDTYVWHSVFRQERSRLQKAELALLPQIPSRLPGQGYEGHAGYDYHAPQRHKEPAG
jgi:hypothetical protein